MDYNELKNKILAILPEVDDIDDEDNLIEKGLSSLKIMRFLNQLRKENIRVSFSELISNPTLKKWSEIISNKTNKYVTDTAYNSTNVNFDKPFQVTEVQSAYMLGRDEAQTLGGVGCHAYLEFDGENIDPEKLSKAWDTLINHHPMLRAVFTDTFMQMIPKQSFENKLNIFDFSHLDDNEIEKQLLYLREETSHRKLKIESGETAGLTLCIIKNNKSKILLDVDLLVADVKSLSLIIRDLADAYVGKKLPEDSKDWSFEEYIEYNKNVSDNERSAAAEYWESRIDTLPLGPDFALKKSPENICTTKFNRRKFNLDKSKWETILKKAANAKTTPAMVLLTAYASILERWSSRKDFLINIPLFNRNTNFNGAENAIADFTTLTLLEVNVKENDTFLSLLKRIENRFHQDMQHSSYSGVSVQRLMTRKYPDIANIAPVVFACNLETKLVSNTFNDNLGKLSYMISQTPQVWLDFQIYETDNGLTLCWDTVDELFEDGMIEDSFNSLKKLLDMLVNDDWNKNFDVIPESDKDFINDYNKTSCNIKTDLLHEMFKSAAKKYPERTAVSDNENQITYKDLDEISDIKSKYLISQGVKPGDNIGVLAERKVSSIENILAILKAGAAYVPIDPENPVYRQNEILENAECTLFISQDFNFDYSQNINLSLPSVNSDSTAYIIYTSGSTGKPKGVVISHDAASNTIIDINNKFNVNEKDKIIGLSSMCFDLSVYDIFGSLSSGAELVMIPDVHDVNAIIQTMKKGITIWNTVPAIMQMLIEALERDPITYGNFMTRQTILLYDLRLVMLSGDWIPLNLPERICEQFEDTEIISLGGATEASIWSIYYPIEKIDSKWKSIPYGKPLANQTIYIIDNMKRLCPKNTVGEICIGGKGLAKEYYKDDIKTNSSFYNDDKLGRLYRTGDYGIMREDGNVEFLGRRDHQIKIRGHRIEIGEIENAFRNIPEIIDIAIVIAKDNLKVPIIYAYFVSDTEIDTNDIKQQLSLYVPEYMIPAVLVQVNEIPLTSNGKVDRNKLLDMQIDTSHLFEREDPATDTEIKLAKIWCNCIDDIEYADRNIDFYEAGGDSMKMVNMSLQIQEIFGVHCTYAELLNHPNIKSQARLIDDKKADDISDNYESINIQVDPDPDNFAERFELTDIQRAYLLGRDDMFVLGGISTHGYYEYLTNLDIKRFEIALNKVIKYQPMLRAVMTDTEHQRFLTDNLYYNIETIDCSNMSSNQQKEVLEKLRNEMSHEVLDAYSWPLFNFKAVKINQTESILLFGADLLIMDAASVKVFKNQIMQAYNDIDMDFEKLEFTFRDFVNGISKLKNSQIYKTDAEYWHKKAIDFPSAPNLPLKADINKVKGGHCQRLSMNISPAEWCRIKETVSKMGISVSAALCTIYIASLSIYSNQKSAAVTVTMFNRYNFHHDVEKLIGDFTSTMLIGADFSESDFVTIVKRVQKDIMEGLEHRTYSGMEFVKDLRNAGRIENNQTIPIVFTSTLINDENIDEDIDFGKELFSVSQTSQVYLDCQVMEKNGSLSITWDYVTELLDCDMMNRIFSSFENCIRNLESQEIDLNQAFSINEDDRKFIENYNSTEYDITPKLLHSCVKDNAFKYPDNIAVKDTNGSYTYMELDKISDSVASMLTEQGIGKHDRVAVMAYRRKETIANIIGVLKAGAAYVPIDPENPEKRQQEIISDSNCRTVLSYENTVLASENYNTSNNIHTDVNDTAYIIYTSGSTGKPKGVVITHAAASNTIQDINERFNITSEDRIIGLSSMCFDLSVYDIFGSLSAGAQLIMVPNIHDIHAIKELTDKEEITIWNSVPAIMQMYVDEISSSNNESAGNSLKLIMMSGDYIPTQLPDKIKNLIPKTKIISLGGATEASIWSIYYPINSVSPEWKTIPYGYPMYNQKFYVIGFNNQICPPEVEGELCIGGKGLASGYYNDNEKTSKSFIDHPELGRIYKTGDYGILRKEGYIEFMGRKDNQVKVLGHRIELGEISNAVCKATGVKDSAVVIRKNANAPQVVAFIVSESAIDTKYLKEEIKQYVPAYMVPSVFVQLDSIPITANGKVDRKTLETFDIGETSVEIILPNTSTEEKVMSLWLEHIEGLEQVGIDWDFYESGGDSIILFRIISGLENEYGIKISVSDMMSFETIYEMAKYVDTLRQEI